MGSESRSTKRLHARRDTASGVHLWAETVVIPTYPLPDPDKNPMFLEKRVYQGSSGRVYPLPFYDRVSTEKCDREYEAIHLENEFLYLMVLPQFGGRIHIGYDKLAGYDFFYRQDVIKPALVGLAGPWISGGVEFNWPQHHRPSTFMPCEWHLEHGDDGSKTVWLSEHEPMGRMKGMHGLCLRPGSTLIELKVRLYNRTPHVQTFLWWANVAARVHERYQSFFPPDVRFVADHAKRAMSTFPACSDTYYGVRYGERGIHGVPDAEEPPLFQPDPSLPADRLDWYANIPVPTSYMVLDTAFDFFGGYDHAAQAGFVHVADRNISPGKKQWTWGNHEFGYAWDRNLTDDGGPYVELMAGVYTDNQPDFSYLAPHETKCLSQYWYPIRSIGPAGNATREAAVSVVQVEAGVRIGICPTSSFLGARVEVVGDGSTQDYRVDLDPAAPSFIDAPIASLESVRVLDRDGRELVSFEQVDDAVGEPPPAASEPPEPEEVATNDELYLIGLHLEQYRHATRTPEPYWEEAVRRDPNDARCHGALGRQKLRRGEFVVAERHFRAAIASQTRWNPNPYDSEPYYQLGLALEFQKREDEALRAFGKAAWSHAWNGASQLAMGKIAARQGRPTEALEHLGQARQRLPDSNTVRTAASAVLRALGRSGEAFGEACAVLARDPLDHWALYEAAKSCPEAERDRYTDRCRSAMRDDTQNALDLAFDLLSVGLRQDARDVLMGMAGNHPVAAYMLASLGVSVPVAARIDYAFPHRLEEIGVLQDAILLDPQDAIAPYLLGNLFYDRRRYDEAIELWEQSVALDPANAIAWRNLGIAYHNVTEEPERSKQAYERAIAANPDDARLLFERDQLWKRLGVPPSERLRTLERRLDLVENRDDLSLELSALYCQTGQPELAQGLLARRRFSPWEGGEGVAIAQHARAHALLARRSMVDGRPSDAAALLARALDTPENLGEARHLLANASDLWYALGEAHAAAGQISEARAWWTRAADFRGDFQQMEVKTYSEMTFYRILALRRLDRESEAAELLESLARYALEMESKPAKIDYFATSLPTMLLFSDDLSYRQATTARFLGAQAALARGDLASARSGLEVVLRRDPSHAMAQDLLDEVGAL